VETDTGDFVDAGDTGTDPLDADTDDGGAPDGLEVAAGLDPFDPEDDLVEATFPLNFTDSEGFLWDVQPNGSIANGTIDAFDGGLLLSVNGAAFGGGSALQSPREQSVMIGPAGVGGIEVTRSIRVPSDGIGFARYVERLRNPTPAPVTATVLISGNLGSNGATVLVATSEDDGLFNTDDLWLVTDDDDGGGDPTMTFVFGTPGAISPATEASLVGDNFRFQFEVDIPPRSTATVIHWAAQSLDQAMAVEKAELIAELDPEAMVDLDLVDLSRAVNLALDRDNDGLPDPFEEANGLDPDDPRDAARDEDRDGLTNLQEFRIGTDLRDADTDGDGIPDPDDDEDGDGLSNREELGLGTSPRRADSDGDGLNDGVETDTGVFVDLNDTGTDPLNPDTDGGGVRDGTEITLDTNPLDPDDDLALPVCNRRGTAFAGELVPTPAVQTVAEAIGAGESDAWLFEVCEAGEYTFTFCPPGGTDYDPWLCLLDRVGNLIVQNDDSCGLQSRVSMVLEPGLYWIAVSGFSTSSGSYTLAYSSTVAPCPTVGGIIPGDCSNHRRVDIADAICLFGFLFRGWPLELPCGNGRETDPANVALIDHDETGTLNLSDGVALLQYLFLQGRPPPLGIDCVEIRGCDGLCDL